MQKKKTMISFLPINVSTGLNPATQECGLTGNWPGSLLVQELLSQEASAAASHIHRGMQSVWLIWLHSGSPSFSIHRLRCSSPPLSSDEIWVFLSRTADVNHLLVRPRHGVGAACNGGWLPHQPQPQSGILIVRPSKGSMVFMLSNPFALSHGSKPQGRWCWQFPCAKEEPSSASFRWKGESPLLN